MINQGSMGLVALLAVAFSAGCGGGKAVADEGDAMMMNADSCGAKVEGSKRIIEGLAKAGDRVYFDLDQADLQPEGMIVSEAQAKVLNKNKKASIRIEGNADERGTREYNLALGERRAETLKSRLISTGVDASRISTISYGEECPAVAESSEAAWAKNRRDVVVTTK